MRKEISVLRSPVISETGMFSSPKESVPVQTGRAMPCSCPAAAGHHRGVVAQAVVADQLGHLPGGVRVAADLGPAQPRFAADLAPLVRHLRLDLAPAASRVEAVGLLAEHACPRAALVLVQRMRLR